MTNEQLRQKFIAFHPASSAEAIAQAWEKIYHHYRESQRHYHTLKHLADLFHQFEQVKPMFKNPSVVAMSIFYHDVVYVPGSADNEERSAVIAETELKTLGWKERDIREVAAYIRSTRNHEANPAVMNAGDLELFLDLDLGVLGADWDTYRTYSQNILREFGNSAMIRWGRRAFMQKFLEKPHIYHTGYFQKKLELKARENIAREINELLR